MAEARRLGEHEHAEPVAALIVGAEHGDDHRARHGRPRRRTRSPWRCRCRPWCRCATGPRRSKRRCRHRSPSCRSGRRRPRRSPSTSNFTGSGANPVLGVAEISEITGALFSGSVGGQPVEPSTLKYSKPTTRSAICTPSVKRPNVRVGLRVGDRGRQRRPGRAVERVLALVGRAGLGQPQPHVVDDGREAGRHLRLRVQDRAGLLGAQLDAVELRVVDVGDRVELDVVVVVGADQDAALGVAAVELRDVDLRLQDVVLLADVVGGLQEEVARRRTGRCWCRCRRGRW